MANDEAPQEPTTGGFGGLLQNRYFLVMWLGQVLSQTADKLVFILLVSIVSALTPSPTIMSAALAIQASPSVLLGAFAGVLVDQYDKRRIMMLTNAARAIFAVLLGLIGHRGLHPAIGLAFLISCCAQPFIPAEAAAIPLVVGPSYLLQANSLFTTTMIGSIIVAFTVGQPLVQWLGLDDAAFAIGAAFLISVVLLFFVCYRTPDRRTTSGGGFWTQFVEGLRYLLSSPAIRTTLWQQTALFGMFAAMSVLAIIFAQQELHVNFSWFLAMAGAGMGLAAWVIGHWGHAWSKDRMVVGGFMLAALALGTLAFMGAAQRLPAFGVSFVIGLSSAFVGVPLQTRLQELVSEELRGKVFGAQNMIINVATTVPLAIAGLLVDHLGIRTVLALVAVLMVVAGALSGWCSRKTC